MFICFEKKLQFFLYKNIDAKVWLKVYSDIELLWKVTDLFDQLFFQITIKFYLVAFSFLPPFFLKTWYYFQLFFRTIATLYLLSSSQYTYILLSYVKFFLHAKKTRNYLADNTTRPKLQ